MSDDLNKIFENQEAPGQDLTKALEDYFLKLETEKFCKESFDLAHDEREAAEPVVYALLEAAGFSKVTTEAGTFYRRDDLYASTEDKSAAYAWLREHGHGALITETVNARTLTAFVKECQEAGKEVPKGVKLTVKKRIGVRAK
jgi:hypothetical protein